MAVTANAITTANAPLKDPHVVDKTLRNIDPKETPILAMLSETSTTSGDYHEWSTTAYGTAGHNPKIAGEDTGFDAAGPGDLVRNFVQENSKAIMITDAMVASPEYTRTKATLARELMQKTTLIYKDMEYSIFNNHAPKLGTGSVAGAVRGLNNIIRTNVDLGATGAVASSDTTARTLGTARALVKDQINGVAKLMFENCGEGDALITGTGAVDIITEFVAPSDFYSKKQGDIGSYIEVYKTNFGVFEVTKSRALSQVSVALGSQSVYLLNTDYLAKAISRPLYTQDLARTGTAQKKQIAIAWTLEFDGEKAHGAVHDIEL